MVFKATIIIKEEDIVQQENRQIYITSLEMAI